MRSFLISSLIILGAATPALSDAAEDAAFIVDAHLTSYAIEERMTALSQQTFATMRPAIEKLGADIVDPDRFMKELLGEFPTEFLATARQSTIVAYQEHLTEAELAALAKFYRTDEGRVLLQDGLTAATLQDSIAFLKYGPGAPLLDHWRELEPNVEQLVTDAKGRLTDLFSLDRIADIMEMEAVVAFESEERRTDVVSALREAK